MVYWLEYISFSDGTIVPMRSVTETGENWFGSGGHGALFYETPVEMVLTEFQDAKERSNFIKRYQADYNITSTINAFGEPRGYIGGQVIQDVVYAIDGIPVKQLLF